MSEEPWYQKLREQWRPQQTRLLLIGESAPDAGTAPEARRFFYAPTVSRWDYLFRAVIQALYDEMPSTGDIRQPWLERLKHDGVFLIDLVPYPVNKLPGRRQHRRSHVNLCTETARALSPDGIVICHKPTYEDLAPSLIRAELPLLHDAPIAFPLPQYRPAFVEGVRRAAAKLH